MTTRSLMGGLALVLLAASAARASSPCVLDAKLGLRECKATCKEDLQIAKDDCTNRDHQCMEVCRAHREECRLATGIEDDLADCQHALDQAKRNCRSAHPAGSPELDQCIDQAQVVGFQCRDAARERARPALKRCRSEFRECGAACPPADPDAPPVDVVACRTEAKDAYLVCRANCVEDFQVAKDACRNRDHACVEGCRATRDGCTGPILTQLESDVGQCNAARDVAIGNCRTAFNPGTPELDQCIDNAQVDAFRCRDAARERARPGFQGCRADFLSCVRACPPAAP